MSGWRWAAAAAVAAGGGRRRLRRMAAQEAAAPSSLPGWSHQVGGQARCWERLACMRVLRSCCVCACVSACGCMRGACVCVYACLRHQGWGGERMAGATEQQCKRACLSSGEWRWSISVSRPTRCALMPSPCPLRPLSRACTLQTNLSTESRQSCGSAVAAALCHAVLAAQGRSWAPQRTWNKHLLILSNCVLGAGFASTPPACAEP